MRVRRRAARLPRHPAQPRHRRHGPLGRRRRLHLRPRHQRLGRLRARRPRPGAAGARARVRASRARHRRLAVARSCCATWCPTSLSPLIVQATFGFAGVILVEASLSFLGLGRLHNYSWGALLVAGHDLSVAHAASGDGARHRHRAGRARLQPGRRRPARSLRSAPPDPLAPARTPLEQCPTWRTSCISLR